MNINLFTIFSKKFCLFLLNLQIINPMLQILFHIINFFNLIFQILQLFLRLILFNLSSFYSSRLFYNFLQFLWRRPNNSLHSPLSNYRISLLSNSSIHKKSMNIFKPRFFIIDQIFIFPCLKNSSRNFNF